MNKEEFEKVYENLYQIYENSGDISFDAIRGKNAKIRKNAERQLQGYINSAISKIYEHEEILQLLTPDSSEIGRIFFFDEFKETRCFRNDLGRLLSDIQDEIKKLK